MTNDKVERRYFLTRTDIDRIKAWDTAEKLKVKVFGKLKLFYKPTPYEISCTNFKKYFEPYLVINGIRKVSHKGLNESSEFGRSISIEESLEEELTLVLDKSGRILNDISFRDLTELNKTYYEAHRDDFMRLEIPFENGIAIFKNHFLGRNEKTVDHGQSLFIKRIDVVFVSVYLIRYEWNKIGESRIIRIDGHTGKSGVYSI